MKTTMPSTDRRILAIAVVLLGLGMAACEQDMSDLDRYIAEVNQRPGGQIEPIPQIEPYEGFTYSVQGERSPFEPDDRLRPDAVDTTGEGPRPDMDRRQEYLERFPLDGLRMQGVLEMGGRLFAIVRDPDGTVHRVTIGNYLGQNHGEVIAITESHITLTELVPDGTGGWNARERRLSLRD
ncbi:pilus assembly protein PilP [Natronospira bacteriovora]|uniref:Pilus assembly protein PilP n=1 Tax=Natronospira bacteriovora TaxID=3069753 RepID=A0ABU0W847_9GAMM|nr:pilus assembly protein PilP [Natronospira sp. AB-CW4]MDQ2070207.1 pilus assembly protein PilP [Natronospira sp. AB-CW4]